MAVECPRSIPYPRSSGARRPVHARRLAACSSGRAVSLPFARATVQQAPGAPFTGTGSYSPSGSTPPGVLSLVSVPLESRPFTELAGIQCPYWLDGDLKQHMGGLQ